MGICVACWSGWGWWERVGVVRVGGNFVCQNNTNSITLSNYCMYIESLQVAVVEAGRVGVAGGAWLGVG